MPTDDRAPLRLRRSNSEACHTHMSGMTFEPPAPLRLILDVDTGVDDALALAFALRDSRAQLVAVLTVAGNVGLDLTTRNTLRVLDWLGASDVPVAAGADRPLSGKVR